MSEMSETATKQKSLTLHSHEVRGIIAGTVSVIRRVVTPQPRFNEDKDGRVWMWDGKGPSHQVCSEVLYRNTKTGNETVRQRTPQETILDNIRCPFGRVGDVVWCREKFQIVNDPAAYHVDDGEREDSGYQCKDAIRRGPDGERWVVDYAADENDRMMDRHGGRQWRSPATMPQWASRISLTITDIRVERLHDIGKDGRNAKEVLASGIPQRMIDIERKWFHPDDCPAIAYSHVWDAINGKKPGCDWKSNPWAWRLAVSRAGGGE